MRFLDLAVAGVIAISSLALILVWNPQVSDTAARRNLDEAHLRDEIVVVLQKLGFVRLLQTPPSDVCSLLQSESNSTVTFSAWVVGETCAGGPPSGGAYAELNVTAGQNKVTIEDWYTARP